MSVRKDLDDADLLAFGADETDTIFDAAKEKGLDLLQITFDKEPCVAKIIDYGKRYKVINDWGGLGRRNREIPMVVTTRIHGTDLR